MKSNLTTFSGFTREAALSEEKAFAPMTYWDADFAVALLTPYLQRLTPAKERGRPLDHELRLLIDAMRYLLRNGCTWRDLPGDFPPWQTVYYHFASWRDEGLWHKLNKHLRRKLRKKLDRHAEPSAGN